MYLLDLVCTINVCTSSKVYRRCIIFKKKKKKEEAVDGAVDEQAVDVVASAGPEDAADVEVDANSKSGIDLKTTLITVAVGLISVVCAFAVTSRVSTDIKEGDIGIEQVNNTATEDANGTKTKNTQEGENKKTDNAGNTSDDLGDIVSDKDIDNIQPSDKVDDKIFVPLESIVANLGGVKTKRYLRVLISLEVADNEAKNIVIDKMVVVRDNLISFFSIKTPKEIEAKGSLFKIRLEIKNSLNNILGHDQIIKQVYFSDFIVQ